MTEAPPRLGLDLGGVLITPLMPGFAIRVAARTGRPVAAVRALLGDDFRVPYWAGRAPEGVLWARLGVAPSAAAELLALRPLPAMARVHDWAARAEVWIVSNHRREWVDPLLALSGVDRLATRILISSETGRVKPDPAALAALAAGAGEVLYVDDQPPNLRAAAALGLTTLRAEADGRWTAAVDAWLPPPTRGAPAGRPPAPREPPREPPGGGRTRLGRP